MDVVVSPEEYCRQVEAYLCRRNGGHLIRVVGPAFDTVCGWAARGIPLTVAFRGVDRHCERYEASRARRRPVRIEFCEADVLDVFDEWRRAVGVAEAGPASGESPVPADTRRRHGSLPSHIEKVTARLAALRTGTAGTFDRALETALRELDAMRAGAAGARGEAREDILARLRDLDRRLLEAARTSLDAGALEAVAADADAELAPFRSRMPPDAYEQSRRACADRLLRERLRLPAIAFE